MRYNTPQYGKMFDDRSVNDQENCYKSALSSIQSEFYDAYVYGTLINNDALKFYIDENKNIILHMKEEQISNKRKSQIGLGQEILTQRVHNSSIKAGDTRLSGRTDFKYIEVNTGIQAGSFAPKFKLMNVEKLNSKREELLTGLYNKSFKANITDLDPDEHRLEHKFSQKQKKSRKRTLGY